MNADEILQAARKRIAQIDDEVRRLTAERERLAKMAGEPLPASPSTAETSGFVHASTVDIDASALVRKPPLPPLVPVAPPGGWEFVDYVPSARLPFGRSE